MQKVTNKVAGVFYKRLIGQCTFKYQILRSRTLIFLEIVEVNEFTFISYRLCKANFILALLRNLYFIPHYY